MFLQGVVKSVISSSRANDNLMMIQKSRVS